MPITPKVSTSIVTFLLIFSLLSAFFIIPPPVKAAPANESTVLYFHDYFEGGLVDAIPPTKDNDSAWPPSILNSEKWLEWFVIWLSFSYQDNLTEDGQNFLDFFNPFKYTGTYEYVNDEDLEIKGEIIFDLYFLSPLLANIIPKDTAKIAISTGIPYIGEKEITSINYTLEPKSPGKVENHRITLNLENKTITLETGEWLIFSIELIPSDKLLGNIIESLPKEALITIAETIAGVLNNSNNPDLRAIGGSLLEIIEASGDISLDDIAELTDAIRSSSFIYDSINHASSVTLPANVEESEEDIRIYYLHDENQIDENKPLANEESPTLELSDIEDKWYTLDLEESLERSKVIKNATANLYIKYLDPRLNQKDTINIHVTLFDGENPIATSESELDKNTLLSFIESPDEITFSFSNVNHEIDYENQLGLGIFLSSETDLGLGSFRYVRLYYDSDQYSSNLKVEFTETDNINITCDPSEDVQKTVLGGGVEYLLNITSEQTDTITIEGREIEKEGEWEYQVNPQTINIPSGSYGSIHVLINSTGKDPIAYEDEHYYIIAFSATGKTGKDTLTRTITIAEEAVDFDIDVIAPPGINIKHGESENYSFIVINNNTGYLPDSYIITAASEHGWNITFPETTKMLAPDEKAWVNVTISIPEDTDVASDVLTLNVTSNKNNNIVETIRITTTVIGPNIIEMFFGFFESLAKTLGLDEMFGTYAPHFLAAIIFVILFFILIVVVYFLTRKFVNVVCLDRIKEIIPGEEAKFEITIENIYKRRLNLELDSIETASSRWKAELSTNNIVLEPHMSKSIVLTVKPTCDVRQDDWTEVKVKVKVMDKRKKVMMPTMTLIKDAKPTLNIRGVFHWPRKFKPGDIVRTSFRVENSGTAATHDTNVVLYVNDKENNKVEDITIPSGGYAEIKMPWIAAKGKNKINIALR